MEFLEFLGAFSQNVHFNKANIESNSIELSNASMCMIRNKFKRNFNTTGKTMMKDKSKIEQYIYEYF